MIREIIASYFRQLCADNCLKYVVIHDFSDWLRPGYNLANINHFKSCTKKFMQSVEGGGHF